MSTVRPLVVLFAGSLMVASVASGQRPTDADAINRLIDQYGATEDAMDMAAQSRLMSADRVWIVQGAGRRTDQATNMRIQQAAYDAFKKQAPGLQQFTEDRDRVIRFHANGAVAIASFYRYTTLVFPPNVPSAVASAPAPRPVAVTLVLEKREGEWKIVHTHVSELAPSDDDN